MDSTLYLDFVIPLREVVTFVCAVLTATGLLLGITHQVVKLITHWQAKHYHLQTHSITVEESDSGGYQVVE
ncbi:MAG: hypothetical protein JO316_15550 [Abitibacteriaceae bacterium]|nr:hypothetical protein [Abditibacteriaceae bacterium]